MIFVRMFARACDNPNKACILIVLILYKYYKNSISELQKLGKPLYLKNYINKLLELEVTRE